MERRAFLAGAAAGLTGIAGSAGAQQSISSPATPAVRTTSPDLPRPAYARNMRLIGHSEQGRRPDGNQIMLHRGQVFVAHMFSEGFSVIDVRDPMRPRDVAFVAAPKNTWSMHLQAADDLLLVINARDMFAAPEFADERNYYQASVGNQPGNTAGGAAVDWSAGMAVYDISEPAEPRRIGFMPVQGAGVHRIWYTGGRWAYVSALLDGCSDYMLLTIDMSDPAQPKEAGRYWLPGMHKAGGEQPGWPNEKRYGLHHAIVHGDTAYAAWRDEGLVAIDVKDRTAPRQIAH